MSHIHNWPSTIQASTLPLIKSPTSNSIEAITRKCLNSLWSFDLKFSCGGPQCSNRKKAITLRWLRCVLVFGFAWCGKDVAFNSGSLEYVSTKYTFNKNYIIMIILIRSDMTNKVDNDAGYLWLFLIAIFPTERPKNIQKPYRIIKWSL